jgi:hypothetical protein
LAVVLAAAFLNHRPEPVDDFSLSCEPRNFQRNRRGSSANGLRWRRDYTVEGRTSAVGHQNHSLGLSGAVQDLRAGSHLAYIR